MNVKKKFKGLSDKAVGWLFIGPTVLLLLAINIYPLIYAIKMSFTNFYGPCNDEQADKVLTAALDLNLKHIDTSNIYGMGKSEERIGEFLSKQGKQANSLFNIAT